METPPSYLVKKLGLFYCINVLNYILIVFLCTLKNAQFNYKFHQCNSLSDSRNLRIEPLWFKLKMKKTNVYFLKIYPYGR